MDAREALCKLGRLTGEYNVMLSNMVSDGEHIERAPKIDIWVTDPENDITLGAMMLLTSDVFVVEARNVHPQFVTHPDFDNLHDVDFDEDVKRFNTDSFDKALDVLVESSKRVGNEAVYDE